MAKKIAWTRSANSPITSASPIASTSPAPAPSATAPHDAGNAFSASATP